MCWRSASAPNRDHWRAAVRDSLGNCVRPAAENASLFRKNVIYLGVFAAVAVFIIAFLQINYLAVV